MRRLIERIKAPSKISTGKPVKSRSQKFKMALVIIVLLTIANSAGVAAINHESLIANLVQLTAKAGLRLEQVKVQGRAHTPQDVLLAAINLKVGQPILGIDLAETYHRVINIGWVDGATVERRLPSTINITLRERVPIALLQTDSQHKLIDRRGTIIDGADPRQFRHLVVVAGDDAGPHAEKILAALKTEPELFAEVWAVSFRSKRRWDVHLKNGIDIKLPEVDPITAWSRLAIIDRKKQIINRDLAVIDLRLPQQLVVEPNIPVRGKGSRT
jgi:cell division protein FtsQ